MQSWRTKQEMSKIFNHAGVALSHRPQWLMQPFSRHLFTPVAFQIKVVENREAFSGCNQLLMPVFTQKNKLQLRGAQRNVRIWLDVNGPSIQRNLSCVRLFVWLFDKFVYHPYSGQDRLLMSKENAHVVCSVNAHVWILKSEPPTQERNQKRERIFSPSL